MEAARDGISGNIWLTADEQTAGRGRRGRPWASPGDNLYASVMVVDPAEPDDIGTLPLVTSLAAREAVAAVLPSQKTLAAKIKWPNDILIGGAKCAGLLLESQPLADGRMAIVMGFGINCVSHPDDTPYPATNLRAEGSTAEPSQLFQALAEQFDACFAHWDSGRGFSVIRQEWLRHAAGIGKPITVNLADRSEKGIFAAIDADGFLLLERPDSSILRVAAGDVFF